MYMDRRTSMGGGRSWPKTIAKYDDYMVEFEPGMDPWNPRCWSKSKKLLSSTIVCLGAFVACLNSAMFAPSYDLSDQYFNVSSEIIILGTSLFILGFAFGPLLWGPGSELTGRRWPLFVGVFGSSIFTLGSATSKDIQTLIICRFLGGVFGASPLCVVPGVLADMYDGKNRGIAISLYAFAVFAGPLLGPVLGAYAVHAGWRWSLYIPAILGLMIATLQLLLVQETSASFVLVAKASIVRKETGNMAIYARQEKADLDINAMVRNYFTRPLVMLFTEPIILLVSIYMSFIYGILYAFLVTFPFVFETVYAMDASTATLPLLGVLVGMFFADLFIVGHQRLHFRKSSNDILPEWRLEVPIIGAIGLPIGLFWFAWTGFSSSIHWMSPTLAGVLIGFAALSIFLPCFTYLVEAYLPLAVSAVAANVMLRSAFGAAFPLFAKQMFENLGIQWAGTLLACLAVAMIPIPIVYRAVGARLRKKSHVLKDVPGFATDSSSPKHCATSKDLEP